jgi:glycerol-3-phosphate acyltransferase PlsY
VATAFGIVLALSAWLALAALGVFLTVVLATRYVSLASILAAVGAAAFAPALFGAGWITAAVLGIAVLIVWRHRANLQRLFAGQESRLSFRRPAPPTGQA